MEGDEKYWKKLFAGSEKTKEIETRQGKKKMLAEKSSKVSKNIITKTENKNKKQKNWNQIEA